MKDKNLSPTISLPFPFSSSIQFHPAGLAKNHPRIIHINTSHTFSCSSFLLNYMCKIYVNVHAIFFILLLKEIQILLFRIFIFFVFLKDVPYVTKNKTSHEGKRKKIPSISRGYNQRPKVGEFWTSVLTYCAHFSKMTKNYDKIFSLCGDLSIYIHIYICVCNGYDLYFEAVFPSFHKLSPNSFCSNYPCSPHHHNQTNSLTNVSVLFYIFCVLVSFCKCKRG